MDHIFPYSTSRGHSQEGKQAEVVWRSGGMFCSRPGFHGYCWRHATWTLLQTKYIPTRQLYSLMSVAFFNATSVQEWIEEEENKDFQIPDLSLWDVSGQTSLSHLAGQNWNGPLRPNIFDARYHNPCSEVLCSLCLDGAVLRGPMRNKSGVFNAMADLCLWPQNASKLLVWVSISYYGLERFELLSRLSAEMFMPPSCLNSKSAHSDRRVYPKISFHVCFAQDNERALYLQCLKRVERMLSQRLLVWI